jgi:hypothetical protein
MKRTYALIFILTLSGCNTYELEHSEIETRLLQRCVHSPEDYGYSYRVSTDDGLTVMGPAEYCNNLFKGDSNEI